MSDLKKRLTVVLESEGQQKLSAQFQAINAAASILGGTVDKSFSALNEKTGKLRSSFQLAVSETLKLEEAIAKVKRELQKEGLGGITNIAGQWKMATDLSQIKEGALPASQQVSSGVGSEAWKKANAERAEFNRWVAAEDKKIADAKVRLEQEAARKVLAITKEVNAEIIRSEREVLAIKQGLFSVAVRNQQNQLKNTVDLAYLSQRHGPASSQVSIFNNRLKEELVNAQLAEKIQKIQSQYTSGKFGLKAADNRLSAAFGTAQKQLEALRKSTADYEKALTTVEPKQRSFAARVVESIGIYRVFNATLNTVIEGIKSIPRIGIQLSQTEATLTAVFGSVGQSAAQMQFLNNEAERTGLALSALRQSYSTFSASALLAGQSASSVQKIFRDVNTTATTLHLSTDQVNGVFLALSQIFNKNKLQAEELTKQLSQTLPGITNQTAEALAMSAAELSEAMKKGLIGADETVEKMMAKMAEAFGGEAFLKASTNLNAELGRLSTAWTHFAENVSKSSEGAMVAIVKFATSAVDSFAGLFSNVYETERAFHKWGATISNVAIAALAAMVFKSEAAKTAIAALKGETIALQAVTKNFAVGGMIAGLSLLAGAANDVTTSLKKAQEEADRLRSKKAADLAGGTKPAEFEFSQLPATQDSEGNIKRLKERLAAAMSLGVVEEAEKVQKDLHTIETDLLKRKEQFIKEFNTKPGAQLFAYERPELAKVNLDNQAAALKRAGKEKEAAILESRASFLDDLQKLNDEKARIDKVLYSTSGVSYEDYQKAEADAKSVEAAIAGIESRIAAAGDNVKKKGLSQAVRAEYKDIAASFQEQRNLISETLQELETEYSASNTSIAHYFSEKRRLSKEDIQLQRESLIEQRQQAIAAKDVVKEKSLNLQLLQLSNKEKKEEEKAIRGEIAAYKDLAATIAEVNAEYLNMQGKGSGGAVAEFDRKNKERLQQLKAEIENPKSAESQGAAVDAARKIYLLRDYAAASEEASKADTDYGIVKDNLRLKEERIQNALKVGAISELEALYKTQEARKEAVAEMERYVAAQEEALRGQPENSPELLRIQKVRNELENLKSETGLFAQKFSTIFENNFADAFSSFVTGSATAGEAFDSFAKGVLRNLADIAAREAASGIMKLAGSAVSSIFGTAVASAKGNIIANGSVQPFYNGGIPDTGDRLQYFPMANGGIGSLREKGPEVIMPLRRDSLGNMGVKAELSGAVSGGNSYSIVVNVQKDKGEDADHLGNKIAVAMMHTIAKQEIADARRSGNMLNKSTRVGG